MADLQQRYLNILKMPRQAVASIPTFGSLGTSTGADDSSIMSKILYGALLLSVIAIVIIIILVVINYILIYYKKTPIFDFGNSPNALIPVVTKNQADWKKYWIDTFSDASPEMSNYNYTMIFDVIILEDKDILTNRPTVLFYRNPTTVTEANFPTFLDYTKEIVTSISPNLYVTYNAHLSELHIVIKLTKGQNYASRILVVPIVAQQQYRIAVNVTDKLAEVYKNGVWIKTVIYGNDGLPGGDKADKFFYTPTDNDKKAARVRNLMLISPGITSGIIRNMGQASINLDDLKRDEAGNLCSP